jgi:hypothetical protein
LFSAGAYRDQATSSSGDAQTVPASRAFQFPSAKLHERWGDYEYDEDLQEDIFLERVFYPAAMPVKNTFIHYAADGEEEEDKEWRSSPAKLLQKSFHTKYPSHEVAHHEGRCRPCAYHLYKIDGCRWGFNCQFCHLCKRGEIKKRKKEKSRAMRQAREARQAAALATVGEGDDDATLAAPPESDLDEDSDDTEKQEEAT